jgi:hypothetical protein
MTVFLNLMAGREFDDVHERSRLGILTQEFVIDLLNVFELIGNFPHSWILLLAADLLKWHLVGVD